MKVFLVVLGLSLVALWLRMFYVVLTTYPLEEESAPEKILTLAWVPLGLSVLLIGHHVKQGLRVFRKTRSKGRDPGSCRTTN